MDLVIYGAQGVAKGTYDAIKDLYPRRAIRCFLVSKIEGNSPKLGGIPVVELQEYAAALSEEDKQKVEILIATPENVHTDIEENLENYGFWYHKRITSGRLAEMMKLYHTKLGEFTPLGVLPVGCREPFLRVYMAKSHKDRCLRNTYDFPRWMLPLQVGAALTPLRLSDYHDDTGDNISYKNGNYSELTGLYWLWKNRLNNPSGEDDRQYYGFMQYRRFLELEGDDLLRLFDNDVDVVLPYPMSYEPNIEAHHERYLKSADWEALLRAMRELYPEDEKAFSKVLAQKYLYNYNVIIARKHVLKAYCEWLFPLLEKTEEYSVPKGADRADRYIGYIGETLETFYFMHNRERLNIVHSACKFLT